MRNYMKCVIYLGFLIFLTSLTFTGINANGQTDDDGTSEIVTCTDGLELIFKQPHDIPICVKPSSVERLLGIGYTLGSVEITESDLVQIEDDVPLSEQLPLAENNTTLSEQLPTIEDDVPLSEQLPTTENDLLVLVLIVLIIAISSIAVFFVWRLRKSLTQLKNSIHVDTVEPTPEP